MGHLDTMGMSSLAMMNMQDQYPWMKEKKPSKKSPFPGKKCLLVFISVVIVLGGVLGLLPETVSIVSI